MPIHSRYIPILILFRTHTNTSLVQEVYQQIPQCTIHSIFSIHINTREYMQIHAIHTIHTNAYPYTLVFAITYQYRHIKTNTYQYIQHVSLHMNTYKSRLLCTSTIHTNTCHISNTGQFRLMHTTTYQYIQYIPILTNTHQYLHKLPFKTYQ